jgi:uncharacterized protein YgbK (DUF1537 family)
LQQQGRELHGEIIIPCFFEGGRFTWNDTHWMLQGEQLAPVGETEFARDNTFGYRQSNLPLWVEEKTKGQVPAGAVQSVSLSMLREQGADAVASLLLQPAGFRRIVVNALDYRDLSVFTLGLLRAEAEGRHFLFRSAASFVKVRGGVFERPLLAAEELLAGNGSGGLVVVGSHVQKSTRQLAAALTLPGLDPIELDVAQAIASDAGAQLGQIKRRVEHALRSGKTAVVYTSREVIRQSQNASEANLRISAQISLMLSDLIGSLEVMPAFLLSKGGITSSDIATRSLRIERAMVIGQVRPGIPVWRSGPESKFPALPLIIFPGNVGDDQTLKSIIQQLTQPTMG